MGQLMHQFLCKLPSFLPCTSSEPALLAADICVAIASLAVDVVTRLTHAFYQRHVGTAARAGAIKIGALCAARACGGAHNTPAILVGIRRLDLLHQAAACTLINSPAAARWRWLTEPPVSR